MARRNDPSRVVKLAKIEHYRTCRHARMRSLFSLGAKLVWQQRKRRPWRSRITYN